jgi:cytochrome c oxidase cbb3-type subunit 4
MDIAHDTLVETAKTWGLFYLIAFSLGVLVYTFWPANRERFGRAEKDVFDEDDTPWR